MSDRNMIISFIKTYKNSPCLWQCTDPDYRDKFKKVIAMKELLKILKTTDKEANICSVRKRINMMRNCFNKELNKVKNSIKRGDKNVHVPKLWYYNDLRFLSDFTLPRPGRRVVLTESSSDNNEEKDKYSSGKGLTLLKKSALPVVEGQEDQSKDEGDMEDDDEESPDWSRGYMDAPSTSCSFSSKSKPKIKPSANLKVKDEPTQRLKYAAYGEHVAEKLRSMPELMATYCQKIINDAIFYAETNNLDITSHISQSNPLQGHNDSSINRHFKRADSADDLCEEEEVEFKFIIGSDKQD